MGIFVHVIVGLSIVNAQNVPYIFLDIMKFEGLGNEGL